MYHNTNSDDFLKAFNTQGSLLRPLLVPDAVTDTKLTETEAGEKCLSLVPKSSLPVCVIRLDISDNTEDGDGLTGRLPRLCLGRGVTYRRVVELSPSRMDSDRQLVRREINCVSVRRFNSTSSSYACTQSLHDEV